MGIRTVKHLIVAAMAVLAAALPAAAKRWKVTRPDCAVGIPCRDYQYRNVSPRIVAVSAQSTPLIEQAGGDSTVKMKSFQVLEPKLRNGHCSISRVTLLIHDDGRWSVSLVAQQNVVDAQPLAPAPNYFTGAVPATGYTNDLLRNEFCVRLRGYARYGVPSAEVEVTAGPPLLFALEPPKFWVQRGETKSWDFGSQSPQVREFFAHVDRIEVEFFYY